MYTINQVAEKLGIKPVTVRWWRNKLNMGTRFGRDYALTEAEVGILRARNLRVGRPPSRPEAERLKRKARDQRRPKSD